MLLTAFIVIEATSRAPMMPLGMFRNRRFAGAQIAAMAISAGLFASFIYIMVYLQEVRGWSPIEAGLVLVPGTMVNLFCAAGTASLHKRVPPVALIAGGLGLVAVGMVISALMLDADTTWLELQIGFIISMAGTGLFNPAVSARSRWTCPSTGRPRHRHPRHGAPGGRRGRHRRARHAGRDRLRRRPAERVPRRVRRSPPRARS